MLAVFNKSILKVLPARKRNYNPVSGTLDCFLAHKLLEEHYPHGTIVEVGNPGYLAINDCSEGMLMEAHEGVFCLFHGKFENTSDLRKSLNLSDSEGGPRIITKIYENSQVEHIVDSPLSKIEGSFAFILFDMTKNYVAIGVGAKMSMPLYWGIDRDDNLFVTSLLPLAKLACNRQYAPFPAGYLYTGLDGILNFKHPRSELETVPWTDDKGDERGSTFRISVQVEGRFRDLLKPSKA